MIKWTIVFGTALIALIAVAKATGIPEQDALLKLIRTSVEDCYEDEEKTIKVEVTDAAFESLITNDPNPPRSTKCMRYCVMQTHNLYNDDGTINISQMQEIFKKVYPDAINEEKLKIIADAAVQCMEQVTVEDRCERAHEMAMCMIAKVLAEGIDKQRK